MRTVLLGLALAAAGCAQVLGIEPWDADARGVILARAKDVSIDDVLFSCGNAPAYVTPTLPRAPAEVVADPTHAFHADYENVYRTLRASPPATPEVLAPGPASQLALTSTHLAWRHQSQLVAVPKGAPAPAAPVVIDPAVPMLVAGQSSVLAWIDLASRELRLRRMAPP